MRPSCSWLTPPCSRHAEARALHTWIEAGQPLIALRALQALDDSARQGEAALRLARTLPAEERRARLIGLLPGAPAVWRAQIAGELLRGSRRIGDADRLQSTVQPLLRALARTCRRAGTGPPDMSRRTGRCGWR